MPLYGNVLVIGATPVVGGTSGRVLYDNAGAVGEATVTGSLGSVVLSIGPTLTGPVTINEAVGSSGLTITGATQTTSQPALSITQTYNNGAVTFAGAIKVNVTNTASAIDSKLIDLQTGGTSKFQVLAAGGTGSNGPAVSIVSGVLNSPAIGFGGTAFGQVGIYSSSNGIAFGGSSSCFFVASSSLVGLSLRNDGSINWSSSTTADTNNPDLRLFRAGAADMQMGVDVNGAAISQTFRACNGVTGTDKTGGNLTIASGKGTGAGAVSSLIFQTPTALGSGTTAQSLATRLTLSASGASIVGGTTDTGSHIIENATVIPAGGTAGKGYKFSSTSNFGVFFGSGAPTLAAAKGSLYLRSDGSGATDRAYVNTDGSTTWTALTTVA